MYKEKLEKIIKDWNWQLSLAKSSFNDHNFIDIKYDHDNHIETNPYFISIIRDNIILFRKGYSFNKKIENPYETIAESLFLDLIFAGFSRIIDLQNNKTLIPTKYDQK